MTTTTKVDREYMYKVSFYLSVCLFFSSIQQKQKCHPQQRLCSTRDNDREKRKREEENQCEWTKRQQKTVRLRENVWIREEENS